MKNHVHLLAFTLFFLLLNIASLSAKTNFHYFILNTDTTQLFATICEGGEYDWNGTIYDQTGEYVGVFVGSDGQDSVVILNLEELQNDTTILEYVLCGGDTSQLTGIIYDYSYGGVLFEEETVIYQNQTGCDSVLIAGLTINPNWFIHAWGETVVPFEYQGQLITEPGFYSFAINDCCTDEGCPILGVFELYAYPNSTEELEKEISFKLFPNPFEDKFRIEFELSEITDFSASLYDLNGKQVSYLIQNKRLGSGQNQFELEQAALPSGTYFLKLVFNDVILMKKLLKR